jgi:uncharacterized protein (TIGR03546 family)
MEDAKAAESERRTSDATHGGAGNFSLVGAQDDRLMRMLKRTSKHHQPAHLAAAVALGVVVGLVPKANLLAVCLYAALLLLPVHTWLALAVSLGVACSASLFDPATHALGSWLLRQQLLRPLWYFLDNTAVLPWLGLHNTVVLGSLVSGVTLAAPTYLISLRFFDRMRWQATGRRQLEVARSIALPAQPEHVASVPAAASAARSAGAAPSITTPATEDASRASAEQEYEPAREAAAIINSWHMGLAAEHSAQARAVAASGLPVAYASADQTPKSASSTGSMGSMSFHSSANPSGGTSENSLRPRPFPPPPQRERRDVVDSLDLAQSASEVLAWVDEVLEDCLSEDTARIVAHDSSGATSILDASAHSLPTQGAPLDDASEQHWLMETTIEVVRWGDGARPETRPDAAQTPEPAQSPASLDAQPPAAPESHADRDSDSDASRRKAGERTGRAIVPFIQPGWQAKRIPQTKNQSPPTDATEAQHGECLSYLLGHLRQEREGRSS